MDYGLIIYAHWLFDLPNEHVKRDLLHELSESPIL